MEISNENADKYSRMYRKGLVADVKTADMANGEGVRTTIFVSGCLFNCYNCFNKKIQDFNYGLAHADDVKAGKSVEGEFPRYYDKDLEDTIIESMEPTYVDGLTLLGGEPFMNTNILVPLCKRVRKEFGNIKTIWSWTGYEWEELQNMLQSGLPLSIEQAELLSLIDVLVDGRYIDSVRKLDLKRNHGHSPHFRGSSNQRIIDVKKSLCYNEIVEDKALYGKETIANRVVDFKELTGKESPRELEELGI